MKPGRIFISLLISLTLACSGCYVFTPLSRLPSPANFYCLGIQKNEGRLSPLELQPRHIYGIGLTYAAHLRETGTEFDPDKPPPVFKKELISLNRSGSQSKYLRVKT